MEHFPLVDRLHQDVLEEKYGPIHAKVLRHDDSVREAHLVDSHGISRTYTLTFFPKEKENGDIKSIDEEIRIGGTIGRTFRKHEYAIRKNVLDVFILEIPKWLRSEFRINDEYAKARISEFYAKKRNFSPIIYGTVLEVYSPDFRPPIMNQVDISQINPSTEELERAGFTREDVWRRIGNNNDWTDVQDRYIKARIKSLKRVFDLKGKVDEYLKKH